MELELGLKITHTRDDITSTADLRIIKDPFGPVFLSRETDRMFILIAHVKGFRRENIHIEINKDGNRISISGEKPVQEKVLMGLIMYKKEVEIRAFGKVFRIPDVVDLDRIKARYNEEQSTLRITMPKKVRGILGIEIEEEKEVAETSMKETVEKEETDKAGGEGKGIQEEIPEEEKVDKGKPEEELKEEAVKGQCEEEKEITEELPMEKEEEKPKPDEREEELEKEEPLAIHRPTEERTQKEPEEALKESEKSKETPEKIAASPTTIESEVSEAKGDNDQPQMEEQPLIEETPSEEHLNEMEGLAHAGGEARKDEVKQEAEEIPEPPKYEDVTDVQEPVESEPYKEPNQKEEETAEISNETEQVHEQLEPLQDNETGQNLPPIAEESKAPSEGKRSKPKLCPPFWFAGSTLIISLIVIVIHLIRARRR